MQLTLKPDARPQPNHWVALQGLTMRLRALVDAVQASDDRESKARRPKRVEAALQSLEADIVTRADRLTEELLSARLPKKAGRQSPVGDIPDLTGLA